MTISTMTKWFVTLAAAGLYVAASTANAQVARHEGIPSGSGSYEDLVKLYDEFLQWKDPAKANRTNPLRDVAGQTTDVYPDYGPRAVAERRRTLREFQARVDNMGVADWDRSKQAEFLAVRSRLDQHDFVLNVSRPWSRDPGFYVDQMLRITFADLPVRGDELADLRRNLTAISELVAQAQRNLTEVAADYADLAIFNLTTADGVGHGFPYRAAPPPGVLGWYDDLLARARAEQPELVDTVQAARDSIQGFLDWLRANRASMNGRAGVGKAAFDWYLKHVKLMPYTSDEIVVLGKRELDRLWALYALERHRNRNLPELEISESAEEYAQRIEQTDKRIRDFLVDEEIITIPDYIDKLDTNVPWIVRPGGPNFWEQVQYRDPTPDHLHAVIPGHRFDGVVERHNDHPIRGRLTSGARAEGWGVYLEEGMLHAGLMDDQPRVRELIYIFGIFRAARVPADVWLQLNEMTVSEVVDYWIERTPYLDENVARVDAEIYLRRPPGYGLGYTIGMLQMQRLLADVKMQQGDDFVLKDFHDEFMGLGRLPLSVIRWEMTGLDDEIRHFWKREPLPGT
ncbi:MAG: DUF885 domain-containing protein [Gammaproteobacteria bacterium]|nr:DUF885 domain-containing protein [Gammaproteobacteria bacterium]MDH4254064.1 DUF885 domain-containing protein [Gammaproteobacteria bacterium]MDH5309539.1 DUF885 domain-containing protein [Gammaproteobacteria bacterium]